ncbi:MAG: undecaprenyl-phosphate glucose phosphotransferase [Burkholderiales bacterium]|nr:undecaprenyl-phosphate glucose phosphotransferase [Burkholderiales bacterium]
MEIKVSRGLKSVQPVLEEVRAKQAHRESAERASDSPRLAAQAILANEQRSGGWGRQRPLVALLNTILCPVLTAISLWLCAIAYGEPFSGHYLLLGILSFLVSSQVLDDVDLFWHWRPMQLVQATRGIIVGWAITVGILVFLGYATQLSDQFDYNVIVTWFALTPVLLLASVKVARMSVRKLMTRRPVARNAVLVGATDLGKRFALRLSEDPYLGQQFKGYFDDRDPRRVGPLKAGELLGKVADVAEHVRRNNVHCVYVCLPMAAQPRIRKLVAQLRDTTASVYFLPDLFVFDLVQARFDEVGGALVVAVCETPFEGLDAVVKRTADLVLGSVIMLLAAPLMLLIALGVKLSSPGPVLFRQRRYGIDGREIVVRKFRTMSVCEDGDQIAQAKPRDPRVTRLGAFLRRTSLDELPQFLDVLEGAMSIVGPRPHAVAHNEQYRKLIPGYMLRHKVKPGITGWAQVNGYRGETDTLEKMQTRVAFDIDYLKHWSLSLDLWIMVKTVLIVWGDRNAY